MELESRLAPATLKPDPLQADLPLIDLGDVYTSDTYSSSVHRFTDRLVVGFDPIKTESALSRLIAADGPLSGFVVVQKLEEHLQILALPSPASDSAASQYAQLESRFAAVNQIDGVRWSAPVFQDSVSSKSWMVAMNEIIVSLKPGVTPEQFFVGNSLFDSWRPLWGTNDQFVGMTSRFGAETIRESNQLNSDPRLNWAQPNYYQSWERHFTPNDALVTSHQWHLNNTGQKGGKPGADANVFNAWDVTAGGSSSIVISVVDDGMEITHPDLAPNLFINTAEISGNGIDDDGNGYIDDVNGWDFTTNGVDGDNNPGASSANDAHATSVAGVAAGKGNNTIGIAGAAYNSKILPVRIFGDTGSATTDANIASAVNYAAGRNKSGIGQWTDVHVTNHSWGGGGFSSAIQSAFTWATGSARGGLGAAAFISSGNGYASTVSFPSNLAASNSGIISVGASNDEDTKSDYSNYGTGLTLVAPSNDLRSGYYGIVTTDRLGTAGYNTQSGTAGDYTTAPGSEFGGTSSASPLAAGIGALVLALDSTLSATQVRNLLKNTTDYIDPVTSPYDSKTGYSAFYGFGRINANTAVRGVGKPEIQVLNGVTDIVSGGAPVNFGNVAIGGVVQRILRVRNQGTQTLNLSSLNITGSGFSIATAITSTSLAVGDSAWLTVQFSPTVGGVNNGTLTINSNDTDEAAFQVQLTGIALVRNVTGTVYEDWNGNGLADPIDVPLAGRTVLFDTNGNKAVDSKSFTSGTINLSIPDANQTGISSNIVVSGLPSLVIDVNVAFTITHTWDSDLQIFLTSPTGVTIPLVLNRGGSGDNFTNTTIDDEAILPISGGSAPFSGTYRPETPLSTFDNTQANGTWTLKVLDDAAQDTGTLVSWSITFVAERTAQTDSAGYYFIEGLDVGTYQAVPLLTGFNTVSPALGQHSITIASMADEFLNRDFFAAQQKAFYGLVVDDQNKDGIYDPGEPGIAGAVVYIDANGNGSFDTGETKATTDALGRYQFLSRPVGTATLRQIVPVGRVETLPASGKYSLVQVGTESQFNNNFATRVGIAPTIVSDGGGSSATLMRFENTKAVTTVVGFDPDPGTVLAYSLAGGADAALFKINSSSGELAFLSAPNFENPTDAGTNNQYDVVVQVSDGIFSTTQSITVIVEDVNEAPTFALGTAPTILEDAGSQLISAFATNIQSGPDLESGQVVSFVVTITGTTGNLTFSAAPAIDASGNLTYTATPDTNGTATLSVVAKDDGGTANGGVDTSTAKTFTIAVTAVNDAPTFVLGGNQTADEDSGAQTAVGFVITSSPGPSDESKQAITYLVSNDNSALFTVQPAISSDGTLTYTLAPNINGVATVTVVAQDDGGTANGGVDTSIPQSFLIIVGDINDAPSFTIGSSQTVIEDSAAKTIPGFISNISAGPPNESAQLVSFLVSTTNPALFSSAPAIDSNGQLTYTLAPNANGSAKVTVIAKDNGGTANGGTDSSAPQFFTITVDSVNDAPTFVVGSSHVSNEDAGSQVVLNFLTSISAGPADESNQMVSFTVTNDNAALFLIPPTIDASGKLTYVAAPNANGMANVTVFAKDNGGTANGGTDTSAMKTFTIQILPVNDAPSFLLAGDLDASGEDGFVSIANFASAIQSGPADEAGQSVFFNVLVNDPSLFAVLPSIAIDGTLSYVPAPLANGVASVSVVAVDDGGTANNGSDRSAPRTFTISVRSFLEPVASKVTTLEDTLTPEPIVITSGLVGSPVTHFQITNIRNGLLYRQNGKTFVSNGDFLSVAEGNAGLKFLPFANANNLSNPGDFGFTVQNSTSAGNDGLVRSPVFVPVSVTPVNDAPTLTVITPPAIAEDAGRQTLSKFAVNIAAGPFGAVDELTQPLVFTTSIVSATQFLQFAELPTVDSNGTLTYRAAPDAFGSAMIRITLDDGNGGTVSTEVPIVVNAVNDPPITEVMQPAVPTTGAQLVTVPNVVLFSPGANNEFEPVNVKVQIVQQTGNLNFVVPPTIDANGTLSYQVRRASIGSFKLAIEANDGQSSAGTQFVTVQVDATGRYELVGYPEFAVGTDSGKSSATFFNPDTSVRFFSQAFPGSEFGARVASADFNGDGIAELVIGLGVGTPSAVQVIDGVTQKAIFEFKPFETSFTGGVFVAAGDVTGDRIADIVITPDQGGGPRVMVIDGSSFQVLADYFGIDDPNFRGGARTAIGDLNGDGVGDLVVAAGFGGGPRVAGFDGKSLRGSPVKLFNDFFAFEQTLRNGVYIAVGDLDGDGISEVIAGGGPGGGPRVAAFSGRDLMDSGGGQLTLVANFFAGSEDDRGGVRIAVKDLDGDTQADLVVGSGSGAGSKVSGYLAPTLLAGPLPSSIFAFDVFDDFQGGVFVG